MFKLPHNCAHFTCYQGNAQNPSRQALTVHELRNAGCTSWIQKRQRNQRSNCQHLLYHRKRKGIPEKHLSTSLATLKSLTVWITTNCGKILKELRIPNYLTCLLRNLHAEQKATLHGTTDWFKIGKGVGQGCILSPYLFNLYADT